MLNKERIQLALQSHTLYLTNTNVFNNENDYLSVNPDDILGYIESQRWIICSIDEGVVAGMRMIGKLILWIILVFLVI